MSNLEHLIENCLCNFERGLDSNEIRERISKDINLEYSGITVDQCYMICQYIWCTFMEDYRYYTQEYKSHEIFLNNVKKGLVTYTPRDIWEKERKQLKILDIIKKKRLNINDFIEGWDFDNKPIISPYRIINQIICEGYAINKEDGVITEEEYNLIKEWIEDDK